MFRAVRFRLIGYVVGVLALVLLLTGALVYALISRQLDDVVDAELRAAAARGAGAPGPRGAWTGTNTEDDRGEMFHVRLVADWTGPGGRRGAGRESTEGWREVGRSAAPSGVPVVEALAATRPGRDDLRTVTLDGQRYRLLTRATGAEGRGIAATQVGVLLAERDRQQRIVVLAHGGGGAIGLALTLIGGLFLTERAMRPVGAAFDRQRRFIGDASHELRTPLTLLRLEVEDLAARDGSTAATRPMLRQIDRLARLVDNLLTLAHLDERRLTIEREPVLAAGLLQTAALQARRLAAPDVEVSVDAGPDIWITGDPDRLHQVLLILVDNAARATPPAGRIDLSVTAEHGSAAIVVADSGPGIPADQIGRIFERFHRVDTARSCETGGSGLGLSIARELVRLHGGSIAIESAERRGTRVTVRLPSMTVEPLPRPVSSA